MAVVLAIYGFFDLVLLLATAQVDRVKNLIHALGFGERRTITSSRELATKRANWLGESTMQFVTIGDKGKVTIPAKLREQFGLKTGTAMDWSVDRGRLVLTPSVKGKARKQRRRGKKRT